MLFLALTLAVLTQPDQPQAHEPTRSERFCPEARAFVRAPLGRDGKRVAVFYAQAVRPARPTASGEPQEIEIRMYDDMQAEPNDRFSDRFYDADSWPTHYVDHPVFAARLAKCFDSEPLRRGVSLEQRREEFEAEVLDRRAHRLVRITASRAACGSLDIERRSDGRKETCLRLEVTPWMG